MKLLTIPRIVSRTDIDSDREFAFRVYDDFWGELMAFYKVERGLFLMPTLQFHTRNEKEKYGEFDEEPVPEHLIDKLKMILINIPVLNYISPATDLDNDGYIIISIEELQKFV